MAETPTSFVEDRHYEMKFQEARAFFPSGTGQLVSIKIRPVEGSEKWLNRWVYPDEYPLIEKLLSTLPRLNEGRMSVSGGRAISYDLGNGDRLLFVEHETGPEFIFAHDILQVTRDAFVAVGAVGAAANIWLKLVRAIRKPSGAPARSSAVRKKKATTKRAGEVVVGKINQSCLFLRASANMKNKEWKDKGWVHSVDAIRLEKRMADSGKIIKRIEVTDDEMEKFVDEADLI
jgi:hypothetical protein